MPPVNSEFDMADYVQFLQARWKLFGATVGLAVITATGICFVLPKQYTARATLLVDPPGVDPRAAIAVSPIYLESLKAYEGFASSDSLFAKAVQNFHIDGRGPIETLKRRVLRVEKIKDTKLVEIAVTLPDPGQAQAMAQYLAEEAVRLDTSIAGSGDRDLQQDAEQKLAAAQKRLEKIRAESEGLAAAGAEEVLQGEAQALATLKAQIEADRIGTSAAVAESVVRNDARSAAEERARVASLEASLAGLEKSLASKAAAAATVHRRRLRIDEELAAAKDAFETANKREFEIANTVRFRTGQLHIVDPGIVPEKPSFPSFPVTIAAAVVLSAGACLFWFTAQFAFANRNEQPARAGLRVAGGGVR